MSRGHLVSEKTRPGQKRMPGLVSCQSLNQTRKPDASDRILLTTPCVRLLQSKWRLVGNERHFTGMKSLHFASFRILIDVLCEVINWSCIYAESRRTYHFVLINCFPISFATTNLQGCHSHKHACFVHKVN